MKLIKRSAFDDEVLQDLIQKGLQPITYQPESYAGLVVMKPWGYEFEVFDNKICSVWLACLKPGQAVSLHCHQRKSAAFLPLSDDITFTMLSGSAPLSRYIAIENGVFHSQENNSEHEVFFLEYEWPSEKTDLVRFKDRYGRKNKGYESKVSMVPLASIIDELNLPPAIQLFARKVA